MRVFTYASRRRHLGQHAPLLVASQQLLPLPLLALHRLLRRGSLRLRLCHTGLSNLVLYALLRLFPAIQAAAPR